MRTPTVAQALRLASLLALSLGQLMGFGAYSAGGLALTTVAVVPAVLSLRASAHARPAPQHLPTLLCILLAGGALLYDARFLEWAFIPIVLVLAVCIVGVAMVRPRRMLPLIAAVALVAWGCGLAANWQWGNVAIDVFATQQNAAAALLHAQNPYSGTTLAWINVVGHNAVVVAPLHFGYGPIFPLLEAPFRLLGDVRVLDVIAVLLTAASVLLLARRAGTTRIALMALIGFPLMCAMVIFSWTDAVTMAGVALWFACMRSRPRIATIALALALAGKPTALVALLPVLFWSATARRQMLWAVLLAALIVLPFALITGPGQFYQDVLGFYLTSAPRTDSLTFNSALHALGQGMLPFAVSALVVGATTVLVLLQRPRTMGDLLSGTAVLTTVSLLVAKTAFLNYYYIAGICLLLAIAGDSLPFDAPEAMCAPLARMLRRVQLPLVRPA